MQKTYENDPSMNMLLSNSGPDQLIIRNNSSTTEIIHWNLNHKTLEFPHKLVTYAHTHTNSTFISID